MQFDGLPHATAAMYYSITKLLTLRYVAKSEDVCMRLGLTNCGIRWWNRLAAEEFVRSFRRRFVAPVSP